MIKLIITLLRSLFASWSVGGEEGQSLAEYVLLASLIAVVCVLATTLLGARVAGLYAFPLP